MAPVTFTSHFC